MSKKLQKAAERLAYEWYRSVLPEDQFAKLDRKKLLQLDKENFEYLYDREGRRLLPAHSIKSFKQSLKKAYRERREVGRNKTSS